jgi:dolichol-phosphate mannosyltransferase
MPKGTSPVYSVIIPVYNEEDVTAVFHKEITRVMKSVQAPYELIFVNDGSSDKTFPILYSLAHFDKSVKVINFSRNFGHQVAITAGIDYARGDAVIILDADLQDPPSVIPKMITKWKQGFDVVYGQRTTRKKESAFKRISASLFYRVIKRLSGIPIPLNAGDFRLMDKKVCAVLRKIPERHRFMRGLSVWTGFRQTAVAYEREQRFAGKTKYPLMKMIGFAADAVTAFSHKPLKAATWLGFITSIAGFIYLVYSLIRFFNGATLEGWTSLVALLVIFNGILFIILGIMGEYIGRIYDEVKARPLYIVRDTIGFEHRNEKPKRKKRD